MTCNAIYNECWWRTFNSNLRDIYFFLFICSSCLVNRVFLSFSPSLISILEINLSILSKQCCCFFWSSFNHFVRLSQFVVDIFYLYISMCVCACALRFDFILSVVQKPIRHNRLHRIAFFCGCWSTTTLQSFCILNYWSFVKCGKEEEMIVWVDDMLWHLMSNQIASFSSENSNIASIFHS